MLAVTVLAVAGTALAITLTTRHATQPRPPPRRDSLAELDARTGATLSDARLNVIPGPVTSAAGTVWLSDGTDHTLIPVNSANPNRAGTPIGIAANPYRLVAGGHALWIADGFDGTVTRVDLPSRTVLPPFRPEPHSTGRLALAYGYGSLWSAAQDRTLTRVDPQTEKPLATIYGVNDPEAVATGADGVWVGQATDSTVLRVDPKQNRKVATIPIGGFATSIAATPNAVWALTPATSLLWRINPHTNAVTASIDVGPNASEVLASDGRIWVTSNAAGTLTQINPTTNTPSRTLHAGHPLSGSTIHQHTIWLTLAG